MPAWLAWRTSTASPPARASPPSTASAPKASVSLRALFSVDLLDQLLRGRIVDGQDGLEPARRPVKNLDRNRMLDPTAHPRPGRARSGHCCAARPVHRYFVR